ncbi:MAG: VOC family protein, partial [Actinomycetota bacterium]|nr:VOC family protein [Actinomycetota bacterium]
MELTYVRLLVDDVERAVGFYRDVLGFKVGLEAGEEVYVELKTDGAIVSFYRRDMMNGVVGAPPPGTGARNIVLCFNVDDVDATYEQWKAAGADFITEPHDQEAWYLRVAHLADTEGNLIE